MVWVRVVGLLAAAVLIGGCQLGTTPPPGGCDPSYEGACLDASADDYDCEGGSGGGPEYVAGPTDVVGDDHFGLDADADGEGCE